jgi:hypothetical protein
MNQASAKITGFFLHLAQQYRLYATAPGFGGKSDLTLSKILFERQTQIKKPSIQEGFFAVICLSIVRFGVTSPKIYPSYYLNINPPLIKKFLPMLRCKWGNR